MDLLPRIDMALSLAFHIVFAAIGMTMPVLMVGAEWLWLRTGREPYLRLAKAWAKGTAVLFAVGAVSGTVLSFELGLLFPRFMEKAGPIIGLPFALEGVAFFTEAVFLGIYLYGWNRVSPRTHLLAGVLVAVSGGLSAVFVTLANAWMQYPVGFRIRGETFVDIEPLTALFSPFAWHEVPHGVLASYAAVATAVAGIHAWRLRRAPGDPFHRAALGIALAVAIPANLVQPALGHFAGQRVAQLQPAKLAALEDLEKTQTHAPLKVGPLEIPGLLSFLATNRFDAEVKGLDAFPPEDRPPPLARLAFEIMILCGTWLFLLSLWVGWSWWRHGGPSPRQMAWLAFSAPLGVVAMEAGWIAAEVGRQPWVIYGVMRTADSVTDRSGLWLSIALFALIYALLAAVVTRLIVNYVRQSGLRESTP